MSRELLRTVVLRPYRKGMGPQFTLRLYYTGATRSGRERLAYTLHISGDREPLFEGDDYGPSPMHAIDSDESIRGLLTFLTLKPGDTDSEYFESYTPRQLDFCSSHADSLDAESSARFGDQ